MTQDESLKRLSDSEITEATRELASWEFSENALRLDVELEDFDAAMRFIAGIADIARDMDHHPELFNVYNKVRVAMTTHDAGGVTHLDVVAAERISKLLAAVS